MGTFQNLKKWLAQATRDEIASWKEVSITRERILVTKIVKDIEIESSKKDDKSKTV